MKTEWHGNVGQLFSFIIRYFYELDRFLRVTFFLGHTNPCQQNILSVTAEEGVAVTDILTAMEKMEKRGDAKVKWVCLSPTSWIRKMGRESVTWFSRWQ